MCRRLTIFERGNRWSLRTACVRRWHTADHQTATRSLPTVMLPMTDRSWWLRYARLLLLWLLLDGWTRGSRWTLVQVRRRSGTAVCCLLLLLLLLPSRLSVEDRGGSRTEGSKGLEDGHGRTVHQSRWPLLLLLMVVGKEDWWPQGDDRSLRLEEGDAGDGRTVSPKDGKDGRTKGVHHRRHRRRTRTWSCGRCGRRRDRWYR